MKKIIIWISIITICLSILCLFFLYSSNALHINKITIYSDYEKSAPKEYTNRDFIYEFTEFIKIQKYKKIINISEPLYVVKLIGEKGTTLLKLTVGDKNISFDRDYNMDGVSLKKGCYETDSWLSDEVFSLYHGNIINPKFIKEKSSLLIDSSYRWDLYDNDSSTVNNYSTLSLVQSFIEKNFLNNELVIKDYVKADNVYGFEKDIANIKKHDKCLQLDLDSNSVEIKNYKDLKCFMSQNEILLLEDEKDPLIDKIVSNEYVFRIYVTNDFRNSFNKLFQSNSKKHRITYTELEEFYRKNKPNLLLYVSKNLGVPENTGRNDLTLHKESLKLTDGQELRILRLQNGFSNNAVYFNDKSGEYFGCILMRSHGDFVEFKQKKIGKNLFVIAENDLEGRGTGEWIAKTKWYLINGKGIKCVLSIPYHCDEINNVGYAIEQKKLTEKNQEKPSLTVEYEYAKLYMMGIQNKNDDYDTLKYSSKLNYIWNSTKETFNSQYSDYDKLLSYFENLPEKKLLCLQLKHFKEILNR